MGIVRNRLQELIDEHPVNGKPLTQARLADATGIPQSTLSRWIGNKVDSYDKNILAKLCNYFKCSVSDIIVYEE